jgi:cytochrome c556
MTKALIIVFFVLAVLLGVVLARNRPSADQQAVAYRQALMTVIDGTFDPLLEMQSGRRPYDPALVRLHASELPMLSLMIAEAFRRDTHAARNVDSAALPYVWTDHAAFLQSAQRLQGDGQALQGAATSGDQDRVNAAIRAMAGDCDQCHRKFRGD